MKALYLTVQLTALSAMAEPSRAFWYAMHQIETSGRVGAIYGDGGRSLGPLQISRAYWKDSKVSGKWEDCSSLAYSRRVVGAYMRRYAPVAWRSGKHEVLARIHNGGPTGHRRASTRGYWLRVREAMRAYERK